MAHPFRPRHSFVREYQNSTIYYEPGPGEDDLQIVTHTRRRVRVPGTEDLEDNYMHWNIFDENSTKIVSMAPSSYRPTPSWAAAVDDFPRDEEHPPLVGAVAACRCTCTCGAAGASPPSVDHAAHPPTAGSSRNVATSSQAGPSRAIRGIRALRQRSIIPYLIGRPYRTTRHSQPQAFSPGRHVSCPIVIEDNSPVALDNRNHTRRELRGGAGITFQSGTVRFALAPHLHPTMVAVAQYPVNRYGLELQFEPGAKRKLSDEIAAEEGGDVFSDGRAVEHNPIASTSTSRWAVPTTPGRKRLCIEALNLTLLASAPAAPVTPAPSQSPTASSAPALSLTPRSGSSTPTQASVSAAWKGKARMA